MRSAILKFGSQFLLFSLALLYVHTARAAVGFTITPSAVSNTFIGTISLKITGITAGDTVQVQQYLDANTNGVIDAADILTGQFNLTDGQATVIGGVTNINVPGDTDSTSGQITTEQNFGVNFSQALIGRYLVRLSSPAGHFTPLTNSFAVTNFPFAQGFTGTVSASGAVVPYAAVLLFEVGGSGDFNEVGGTLANHAGVYALKAPPGTYALVSFQTNFVANTAGAANLVLQSGATFSTNLSLLPTTQSISGRIFDANNSSLGLPGLLFSVQTQKGNTGGQLGIAFTDSNGNFTARVNAGQWRFGGNSEGFAALGYVGIQNKLTVDTSTGSVSGLSIAVPKGNALFYGTVKDASGNPLPGVAIGAFDNNNNVYQSDGYTAANGYYVTAALGGLGGGDPWNIEIDNSSQFPNKIFSSGPAWSFNNGGNGTNLSAGTAVEADFVALSANYSISGSLKDGGGNPIPNVNVYAFAALNGVSFNPNANTDSNGNYSLPVVNGSWSVGVNCCNNCGGNSLPSNYACPNQQNVNISNGNQVVNLVALAVGFAQISGSLQDASGHPIPNVEIYASTTINGTNSQQTAITDNNGDYSIVAANGIWTVGVNCCTGAGCNNALPTGYQCPNQQAVSISNNNITVNFVSGAPGVTFQITGTLKDGSGNPLPNVQIYALPTINGVTYPSPNSGVNTDAGGNYSLSVTNGTWTVVVNCCNGSNGNNCGSALNSNIYECPNQQVVTVSGANVTANFVASTAGAYQINGSITDSTGNGVGGISVTATASGNSAVLATTSSNGSFTLSVNAGTWLVTPDCNSLSAHGYACVGNQTVTVSSSANNAYVSFTLQICGPLQVTTSTLTSAFIGSNYSFQLITSGCHPPFTWSLTPGSLPLPQGLLLSTNGVVSGSPGAVGTNYFSARVTDGQGAKADGLVSIAIFAPLQITNTALPNGTLGAQYSAKIGATGGYNGFFGANVVSGTFPPGLNLFGDGSISGTPSQLGTFQFTIQIIDNTGLDTAQAQFTIIISQPNLQVTTTSVTGASVGAPFSFQLQASGGAAPYLWSVALGSQPPPAGLTLGTNGVLSGTPSAASMSTIIVRVTDANQLTTTAPVQITVSSALSIGPLTLPAFSSVNGFQFTASAPTGQNYTVQYSLSLTNWFSLFVTNPTVTPFTIVDRAATNKSRFYRLFVPAP